MGQSREACGRGVLESIHQQLHKGRYARAHVAMRGIQRPDFDGVTGDDAPFDEPARIDIGLHQRARDGGGTEAGEHRIVDHGHGGKTQHAAGGHGQHAARAMELP